MYASKIRPRDPSSTEEDKEKATIESPIKKAKILLEDSATSATAIATAAPVVCKSWREFGDLVKLTPPQFERDAIKPWQHLIDLAIEKLDHSAIVYDKYPTVEEMFDGKTEDQLTTEELEELKEARVQIAERKGSPTFPDDVSIGLGHLAYITAKQLIKQSTKEQRKQHKGTVSTWNQFVTDCTTQADVDKLYEEYTAARDNMYDDINDLFRTHLPFRLRCSGPEKTDFRDLDDCDWMGDMYVSYHGSGQSAEDKQEEDYADHLEDVYRNPSPKDPEPEEY